LSCKKPYPHVDWYHDEQSTDEDVDVRADGDISQEGVVPDPTPSGSAST